MNASRPAEPEPDPVSLEDWMQRARRGAVVERVHDLQIDDPYRALERDSALTRSWIEAQTERTERALSQHRSPATERRLSQLLSIGSLSGLELAGGAAFLMRREGDREQAALYVLGQDGMPSEPLLDPLSHGERAAFDWFYPSPDGRAVAFGVSHDGDERSELRVFDRQRGELAPDRIAHTKWSQVAWLADGSGFYYSRYPAPGEPDYDAEQPEAYFPRVFFHRLGTDPKHDPLVFGGERPSDFPLATLGGDDRYLVIVNHRGFTASDVYLLDRGAAEDTRVVVPDDQHRFIEVVKGHDKRTTGTVHRGLLYLLTDLDAPRRRILAVEPARAGEMSAWREIVPEAEGTIEEFVLLRDRIAVHYIEDVRSRLLLFELNGRFDRELSLPARGSIEALSADPRRAELSLVFSSFFYPPAVFRYRTGADALELRYQVAHDLPLGRFAVEQQWVPSADGTPINVAYVRRDPLPEADDHPVLIYGYGGFDVSLLPSFTRSALYFLERGGIYAVANLRGGGEFGESWHRAGMLANKPRVFEDMEAVIRWFAESGISRPDRIAITGGSNGGLLVGALVTRAPETFRAAASYVGLYDMLRYHLFPPARLWISEYGDPRVAEDARVLHAYSPYHRIENGARFPAVLIETAQHDTRVFWGHSTKFAARLQEAQAGPHPIYFYMEDRQGHGRGTRLDDMVERYARMYAFIEHELGMR